LSIFILSYRTYLVKQQHRRWPSLWNFAASHFLSTIMATQYPKRGATPTYVTLAVLAFILVMIVLFMYLRRTPPAKSQPDKPQSSQLIQSHARQNNLS